MNQVPDSGLRASGRDQALAVSTAFLALFLMGVVLTADGVAEAVVPMMVATLRDQRGSYTPGFLLLVALAAVGAAAVALLPLKSAQAPTLVAQSLGRTDS